jgi:hypothetical protein
MIMNRMKLFSFLFFVCFTNVIFGSGPADMQNFINNKHWAFVENKGQISDENGVKLTDIKYYGHQGNVYIYCRPDKISFVFTKIENEKQVSEATGESPSDRLAHRHALMMQAGEGGGKATYCRTDLVLQNSNQKAEITGTDQQEYYENYYSANTGENGILAARSFKTIKYSNIYPNIDLLVHVKDNGMKYEFVVRPGGDVNDIQLKWNGANKISLLNDGGIKYQNGLGEMQETAPVSFLNNGLNVSSQFIEKNNNVHFSVGSYDRTQILTIDPTLTWSTYLGGSAVDNTQAMWIDNAGNVVVTGQTQSTTGIATSGAFLTSFSGGGNNDAFVSKFSSSGSMLWSTYYGNTGYDDGWAINVDKYNNIYMTGTTSSTSGIATSGAYQSSFGGTTKSYNAYIVKFSPGGSRFWGTYFGSSGQDQGLFLALDQNTNIYLTCWITSSSGIATSGAYQTSYGGGGQDASLEKFDSTGTKLTWSTYFGGSGYEVVNTVATDLNGNAFICGYTSSSSGIASSGAYQTAYGGGSYDAFVASFSGSGGLNWATYLGGSNNDYGWGVTADISGNVIACGQSYSTSGIATTGAFQQYLAGSANAFVSKFSTKGSMLWSTYYGGSSTDVAYNLTTDANKNIWITGTTSSSSGLATGDAFQKTNAGSGDVFFAKFISQGYRTFGTYFGGSGNDFAWDIKVKGTKVYVTGGSASTSGIATSGAYQTSNGGSTDAFISLFTFHTYLNDAGILAVQSPAAAFCASTKSVKALLFNNGSNDLTSVTIGWSVNRKVQTSYSWTGTIKKDSAASVTIGSYSFPSGIDTILVWTTKPNTVLDSLTLNDTARIIDTVSGYPKPSAGGNKSVCPGGGVSIGSTAISGHKYSWTSNPSGFTSSSANAYVSPTVTTTYYLTETNTTGGCTTVDSAVITVNTAPKANAGGNHTICYGGSITLGTTATKNHTYTWSSVPTGYSSKVSNPTVTPTVTTTYYVTETDTLTGCFAYDNGVITVSPPAKANAGGNRTICSGSSITLGASAVSGHTYSWKSKPVGFTSTVSNPTVNPIVATVYYLTDVITATGCTALDSAAISINPLPAPNAGGNKSICSGNTVIIGSTAVTGHTYSWTSKPSGFASSVSKPSVNPTVNTTYYMTETITATGCSKTDSAVISINPLPTANAGGNHSICWGDSYQVGGLATSGHTYSWTSKPTGFSNTTSNPNVSPTVTTTYYLKETITSTGCSKTDSAIITVNSVKVSAGGNHTICSGSSITLGGSAISGVSYSWSSSPAGYSANSSNPSASPKVKTTYLVIATDAISGCSGADSAVITVNPIPNAVTGTAQTVCAGSPVSLGTTATSGNTYSWTSKPGGFTSIVSNPTVTPKVTTTYYLTETITSTGCGKTDSVKITTKPIPNAGWSMDHFGITTYLHAQDSSLTDPSYKWKYGDGDSATGHLAKHIYPKNKSYLVSLRVTGTNGCTSEYDSTIIVTVSGIGFDVKESNELHIYPNPFSSATTIEYTLENPSKVNIALMDVTGKQIGVFVDQNEVAGKYKFDINSEKYHLTPGVYFVKFMVNDKVLSRQVVKM